MEILTPMSQPAKSRCNKMDFVCHNATTAETDYDTMKQLSSLKLYMDRCRIRVILMSWKTLTSPAFSQFYTESPRSCMFIKFLGATDSSTVTEWLHVHYV